MQQCSRVQQQHAKEAQRLAESPLIDVLVETEHIQHARVKPTVGKFRKLAQAQNLKPGTQSRVELIQMLLEHIQSKQANGNFA